MQCYSLLHCLSDSERDDHVFMIYIIWETISEKSVCREGTLSYTFFSSLPLPNRHSNLFFKLFCKKSLFV